MVAVSVIVPNLHSPIIGQTVHALCNQQYPRQYEILVVGQDRFNQVQENERVRFIPTRDPVSPAVARNIGIQAAKGEILAFIDADCIAASDWLSRLMAHYTDSNVTVVGGGVDFPADNFWILCDNLATFYEYLVTSRPGTRLQLPSLNLSIRHSALEQVGGFDERYPLPAGEDAELTTRLRKNGHILNFDPTAKITHFPQRRSILSVFKHAYQFGLYSIKVDRRYQDFVHTPLPLRQWWMTILFSPILAGGVTWKVASNKTSLRSYWFTLPIIFITKVVWCFGAARTLRRRNGLGFQK